MVPLNELIALHCNVFILPRVKIILRGLSGIMNQHMW